MTDARPSDGDLQSVFLDDYVIVLVSFIAGAVLSEAVPVEFLVIPVGVVFLVKGLAGIISGRREHA